MKIDPGLMDDFRETWGLENSEIFDTLEPVAEFGLTAEDDYRRTWQIPASENEDRGWMKFKEQILSKSVFDDCHVCYLDYQDWIKDDMKLGKWLDKYFTKQVMKEYGHSDITFKNDLFGRYFQKEMDAIGAKRVKGKENTVMLTWNPEDKLMASMHPAFRSCMTLTSEYGYWRSLLTTITNPNIAMLTLIDPDETTSFKLKNGYTVCVPRILSRTFVVAFKNNKDKIAMNMCKFYDKAFTSAETMSSITDMNWFHGSMPEKESKWRGIENATFPIFSVNKKRSAVSPYFDTGIGITDFNMTAMTYDIEYGISGAGGGARAIDLSQGMSFYNMQTTELRGEYK